MGILTRTSDASSVSTQDQLGRFAGCVFAPDDIVEVRRLPSGRSSWHKASELPELGARLADENEQENVHIGLNPRTQHGGTKAGDVRLARCLFADFDGGDSDGARVRWKAAGGHSL